MDINDVRVQATCGVAASSEYQSDEPFIVSAFLAIMNAFFEFCTEQQE